LTSSYTWRAPGCWRAKTRPRTTDSYDRLAGQYPDIKVKRGLRFVEGPKFSTGGGLSCGIDLALRVAERYFGREAAQEAADYMEYQGKGWIV
jgi:transcriptional regulator GlxA family with amidase domain